MLDLKTINWKETQASLNEKGYSIIPSVIDENDCQNLIDRYKTETIYRSTINMERYRFGKGEYKYYSYPLPQLIQTLRENLYPSLAKIANEWMSLLSIDVNFPILHNQLIEECHSKNQHRPTSLILHYQTGGFNTLHQDLYGEIYFPFQVVFPLSQQGADFSGGEFILIEQLPRAQSRAQVVQLNKGDALIFTTNFRPVKGRKEHYRAKMKHGISSLTSGERYALGIIFHDAG